MASSYQQFHGGIMYIGEQNKILHFIDSASLTMFSKIEISNDGEYYLLVVPGYYEQNRLKLIRVKIVQDQPYEASAEISLDHLPTPLLKQEIKYARLSTRNSQLYAILLYPGGVIVILELTGIIADSDLYMENMYFLAEELITTCLMLGIVSYAIIGRAILIRRRRQQG
jgi:hypothetical protein